MTDDMTIRLGGEEYLLRHEGSNLRIGTRQEGEPAWLDTVDTDLFPEGARSALERGDTSDEALLGALRGVLQGEVKRGG